MLKLRAPRALGAALDRYRLATSAPRAAQGFHSHWRTVRGVAIHDRRSLATHNGAPPMILLHGLAVSHRYLMPLAAGLAGHHPVHLVDLPGFGLSGDPGRALDVVEHAEHLAAWLAAAGLPSAVVVGNSFGCQVAVQLAVRHPDRVAGTLAHALRDPIEHKLPRVGVPTLVTRGSREPIVPMAWATTVTRLLPTAELAVVPGPHNANYGAADHLTDLVLAFVHRRVTAKPNPPG